MVNIVVIFITPEDYQKYINSKDDIYIVSVFAGYDGRIVLTYNRGV